MRCVDAHRAASGRLAAGVADRRGENGGGMLETADVRRLTSSRALPPRSSPWA
ncbi:Hypothetical protein I596_2647 [Dokdonella koreensis DS-123]|uniref:Uncharacterized protein n=1 Tax=Dokdonella koreensis DS-123 TaxID=1300342 RepID=A0A160DW58_9GAMM|nr:Hypothetical protein I596_2647 [Dokdonella koreensis DS-123]